MIEGRLIEATTMMMMSRHELPIASGQLHESVDGGRGDDHTC